MPQPENLPEGEFIKTIAKPTREGLLASYAKKPLRAFMEIDANPVRVQILEGTTKGEVLYYLLEIVKMLREDWYRLDVLDGKESHGLRPKRRKKER
jgi:hypothetical protein